MKHVYISAILAACSLLSPAGALSPTVNLTYSTYVGTALNNGVTQWLGMRYAAPPLGDLRFAPPQDPPFDPSIQEADQHGLICLPTAETIDKTAMSEDCLFLDVYAPSNATASSSSSKLLPVYFFIQGGGFNDNSNANYNGSGLIEASGHSIVVVNFNYRVGPYGFLAGAEGVTPNIGLLDQRKAMAWVQQHISQFGGDPGHVVLGGDSAGAASISLHLTSYGGSDGDVVEVDPATNRTTAAAAAVFHAAAAESVSLATVLTPAEARYQFVNLAVRANCTGSDDAAALACLRALPAAALQAADGNSAYPGAMAAPLYMWNPTLDGTLVPEVTYAALAAGRFRKVPVIFGDDTNGGTIFTPTTTATLAESDAFLRDQFPDLTLAQLAAINGLYPNANESACPAPGCYWRQVSNAYGELRYMCPGLHIAAAVARAGVPSYAYRWNVEDKVQMEDGYGVPHTVEVNAIWGPENVGPGDIPGSYLPNGTNARVVPITQAYWTSFVRAFDPNAFRLPGTAEWVSWNDAPQQRLLFNTSGVTAMETLDPGLQARCAYFATIGVGLQQ